MNDPPQPRDGVTGDNLARRADLDPRAKQRIKHRLAAKKQAKKDDKKKGDK